MVIWVIGRNYPLQENGLRGSFELEQAKMLSRHGNDVHYLACSLHPLKRIKGKKGIQTWINEGVKVTVLSAFCTPRVYPFYFNKARNMLWTRLFKMVEKENGKPEVIHIHYPSMLMIADAVRYYHERGVKIVATEHWTKVLEKKLDYIELKEFRKYNRVLDSFICVGLPLKIAVKDLTGMDSVIVPNIVNSEFKISNAKHEGFRFVAVGRLVRIKQFDRIIEAFCDCFLGEQDITLTIIGDGEEKNNLQRIIEERNAVKQVKLTGVLTRENTAEFVSNCDNLICFSRLETFGVPIIEAWACGLSTITSTAAAIIDDFDERLGIRISFDDYDGLKAALKYIYDNRNIYDKSFISEFAHSHFSENVIVQRLIELYK